MEAYGYSKQQAQDNHPKRLAAKVGMVTGATGMALSLAIDLGAIPSNLATYPGTLAAGALAGFLCLAVSWRHLSRG